MTKTNRVRNVAYVSGTRADFGLMSGVLERISQSQYLRLQLYITGMHLMSQFGETKKEVLKQYSSARILPAIFQTDDRKGMALFISRLFTLLIQSLSKDKPDIVMVMGDRAEMLCTAVVAAYLGIPIAHIHGGDKTTTIDESARHAITKLAHIHFAATKDAANRIKNLGEEPWRIYVTGAPALDVITHKQLPTKREIYQYINIKKDSPILLVTLHSVTEHIRESSMYMKQMVAAVKVFNLPVVIIYPNADAGGRAMIRVIEKEKHNPLFRLFPSMPYEYFLALERESSVWIGNSSAGVIESTSFKIPVINVGDRQSGRVHARNVLNVSYEKKEIIKMLNYALYNKKFIRSMHSLINPWGDGKAGERIVKVLEYIQLGAKLLTKQITY